MINCQSKCINRKAESKFEDSLKPLSKTLKQEERKEKCGIKTPRKENRETTLSRASTPLARPCSVARSCHPARLGRATFLAGWSCWCSSARPCLHARPCLRPFCALSLLNGGPFCAFMVGWSCWCSGTLLLNSPKMLSLLMKPEGSP